MKSASGYLSGVIIETSMHDTCKHSICKAFCGTSAGRSLAPFETQPLPDFQITFLGNLGLSYAALGEYRQAIMYYEQALDIAESTEDQNSQAIWSLNLGN